MRRHTRKFRSRSPRECAEKRISALLGAYRQAVPFKRPFPSKVSRILPSQKVRDGFICTLFQSPPRSSFNACDLASSKIPVWFLGTTSLHVFRLSTKVDATGIWGWKGAKLWCEGAVVWALTRYQRPRSLIYSQKGLNYYVKSSVASQWFLNHYLKWWDIFVRPLTRWNLQSQCTCSFTIHFNCPSGVVPCGEWPGPTCVLWQSRPHSVMTRFLTPTLHNSSVRSLSLYCSYHLHPQLWWISSQEFRSCIYVLKFLIHIHIYIFPASALAGLAQGLAFLEIIHAFSGSFCFLIVIFCVLVVKINSVLPK